MRVHHITPSLANGDAVSNNVIAIAALLNQKGFEGDVFCQETVRKKDNNVKVNKYDDLFNILKPDDVIIYHLSTGTVVTDDLITLDNRIIVIYHNITPAVFFEPYSELYVNAVEWGRSQIALLKNCEHFICDSEYNKQDLIMEGIDENKISVVPLLIDFDDYAQKHDVDTYNKMNDGVTNIIFVGRVAPNKKHEDIIKSYAYYKKFINPKSRLTLIGSIGIPAYSEYLNKLVEAIGVEDVKFCSHVPFPQILAYYKSADVFLCMSEHEGFCVPLLEAMYFDVPVIAYDATAVPETLGGSSVIVKEKDFPLIAEAINEVVTNKKLRKTIIERQQERLKYFDKEKIEKEITDKIIEIIENKQ